MTFSKCNERKVCEFISFIFILIFLYSTENYMPNYYFKKGFIVNLTNQNIFKINFLILI